MTRTAKYKIIYFAIASAALIIGAVAGLATVSHLRIAVGLLALVLLMLVPGRVQRYFWSEMLAGLYHLNRGNYELSRRHSERFLTQLQTRPWLKRLIWLGTSSYSRDIEVITRNNLGAALLKLGDIESARKELELAIALDPLCPLPYRNMGTLLLHLGPSALALPWLEKAERLGLKGDWSDQIIRRAQHRHASQAIKGGVDNNLNASVPPPDVPEGTFCVILLNDDSTPFEFAVACLEQAFGLTGFEAIRIAAAVGRNGEAACACFESEADARAAADRLETLARDGGHALSSEVRTKQPCEALE